MSTIPPTVNSLDPVQRSRLLKSTRKLGDLLGAIPHVVDLDSLQALPVTTGVVHLKREDLALFISRSTTCSVASIAGSSQSDDHVMYIPVPRSSFETYHDNHVSLIDLHRSKHKKQKSEQLVRPLLLRLQTVPSAETCPKPQTITECTTNVTTKETDGIMPEPDQDPIVLGGGEKLRRRRIAKLTRTLGENIPAELVFPQHHKSSSEPVYFLGQNKKYGKAKDRPLAPVPKVHIANISTSTLNTALPPVPSQSLDEAPLLSVQDPVILTNMDKQKDWSGEWSIKNAEKRAMALRNLKSR